MKFLVARAEKKSYKKSNIPLKVGEICFHSGYTHTHIDIECLVVFSISNSIQFVYIYG